MDEKSLNEKLRQARKDRAWSIEDAADHIGVSRTTYIRWEQGTQRPHGSTLKDACNAFHMSIEQLGFHKLGLSIPSASNGVQRHMIGDFNLEKQSLSQDMFSLGIMALIMSQRDSNWSLEELHHMIDKEMKQHDEAGSGTTRRDALKFLAGMPLAFLNLQGVTTHLAPNESLPLLSAGIPACWQLYYSGGDLKEIQRTIGVYIRQLEPLAQSSKYSNIAANLVSQAYQLTSMLALEYEDYNTAIAHTNCAIDYAQLTTDQNVYAAAIMRKAGVLYYQKRYRQMSGVLQSAMPLIKQVGPLMQARIYSELGATLALNAEDDSLRYTQMAIDICPDNVEADPAYSYTHASPYVLYLNQEVAYSNLGQYDNALQALQHAEKYVMDTASTRSMELITHQATAAIALNDLDISCERVLAAIAVSNILQSDLWYSDVERLYQQLQTQWRHEKRVKDIGESLRLR